MNLENLISILNQYVEEDLESAVSIILTKRHIITINIIDDKNVVKISSNPLILKKIEENESIYQWKDRRGGD